MSLTNVLKKRLIKGEASPSGRSRWAILGMILSMTACATSTSAEMLIGLNSQTHVGKFDATGQAFAKELGAQSIRVDYGERQDLGIDWAAQNGKSVVLMLGYGDGCDPETKNGRQCYADRSADLAQEYGSNIEYYEVWNEWNGGIGLGCVWNEPPCNDAAMYTDLLCRTYDAIKAVRQSAIVVGGAIGGANEDFLTGMLNAGAGDCMDMLSLHLYVYRQGWPGHVPIDAPASDGVGRFIEVLNERNDLVIQKTGGSIPILVTEAGRKEGNLEQTVDEELTADYITELYSRAPELAFLEGIWWYALEDTSKGKFGLLRSNNTKKPAFDAYQEVASEY